MEENKKKKTKIKKKRIAQVLLFLCVCVIAVCFFYSMIQLLIEPTGVCVVENGKIYNEEPATGYIIREETVISGENYQNGIVTIKSEGERVSKGDSVFRYCSTNEDKLKDKIAKLDEEIQSAIEGQNTSIYSTDIQLLEKQIEEKVNLLQSTNNIEEIQAYKSDISNYMIKKAKIAGELSPSGSYINKLISQRSEYENQLNSGQEYISSPESGLVSYKIDGFESLLKANDMDSITEETLAKVKMKTGQTIPTSTEQGKIVNNFFVYIACIMSSDNAMNTEVGKTVKLRLSNNDEVSAEVAKISEFVNGKAVIFFRTTKDVEYLMNYRKISVDVIWWSASGLKVPNSSIVTEGEKQYVIRSRIGYTDKILVKVVKQNDKYAIVENYSAQELRDMGYTTEQITSRKNVSLYDEIILKPEQKEK